MYEITLRFDAKDDPAALDIAIRLSNEMSQLADKLSLPHLIVERVTSILVTRMPFYGFPERRQP